VCKVFIDAEVPDCSSFFQLTEPDLETILQEIQPPGRRIPIRTARRTHSYDNTVDVAGKLSVMPSPSDRDKPSHGVSTRCRAGMKPATVLFLLAGTLFFAIGNTTTNIASGNYRQVNVPYGETGPFPVIPVSAGLWNYCIDNQCNSVDINCISNSFTIVKNCNQFLAARAFGLLSIIVSFFALAAAVVGIFKRISIIDKTAVILAGAAAVFGVVGFAVLTNLIQTDVGYEGFNTGYSFDLVTAGWIVELVGAVLAGVATCYFRV